MFIIDEIYRDDGVQLGNDLPGGAGTYALIGARLFNPPPESKRLSMIIDMGNDFPANTLASIQRFQCSILLRQTPDRRTTRGCNLYGPGDLRSISLVFLKLTSETLII